MLGAAFGSFIGAMVTRWPQGQSVHHGRSHCDGCGRTLGPTELVPIASFLWQHGVCKSCGAPIDRIQPIAEIVAALIGLGSGMLLPGPTGIATAILGWELLALALIDLRAFWLPDRLTALLAATGLAVALAGIGPPLVDRLIGGLAGFGALQAIRLGYRALRGREGMGGGDPKIVGAIGLWIGWRLLPVLVVLACLIALGLLAFRQLTGRGVKSTDALPFGAFLAIAAYPCWIAMLMVGP